MTGRIPFSISVVGRGAIALLFLCTLAIAAPQITAAFRNLAIGDKLPEFKARELSGKEFSSATLRGKVVAIVFFKAEQQHSQKALLDLSHLANDFLKRDVKFIAICVDEQVGETLQKLVKQIAAPFTYLVDADRLLDSMFGVIVMPTTALFDKNGVFRYYEPSHAPGYYLSLSLGLKVLLGDITGEQRSAELESADKPLLSNERKAAQRRFAEAQLLGKKGEVEQAIAACEKAVAAAPDYVEARIYLGELLLSQNEAVKAQEHFALAVKTAQPPYRAKLGLAATLSRLGKYDDALSLLRELEGQHVDKARFNYELGRVYEAQGKKENALQRYRKAAEAAAR